MKSILQRSQPVGMPVESLTERPAWQALLAHHRQIRNLHLRDFFANDASRGERMVLDAAGLYFDYSKHRVTGETIALLLRLARECDLAQRIDAMFTGAAINVTEQRPALHVALRASFSERIFVDGTDVDVSGTRLTSKPQPLWGGLGFGGSLSWADDRYAVHGELLARSSLEDFGDSRSFGGTVGFSVKW